MRFYTTDYRVELTVRAPFRWHRHPGSLIHHHLKTALGRVDAGVRDKLLAPLIPEGTPYYRPGMTAPAGLVPLLPPTGSGPQGTLLPGDGFELRIRRFGRAERHVDQAIIDALESFDDALVAESVGRHGPRERTVEVEEEAAQMTRASLRFLTPAHVQTQGKLAESLHFGSLIDNMRRRLEVMCSLYGDLPSGASSQFRALRPTAREVLRSSGDLHLERWQRGGNTTRARHSIVGFLGKFSFKGPIGPFAGTLRAAEDLHIGRMTSWGLGRIAVQLAS